MNEIISTAIQQGGITIIPLLLCSIITLAVIIERFIFGPRRSKTIPQKLLEQIHSLLQAEKVDAALAICKNSSSALGEIAATAIINKNRERDKVLGAIETAGKKETSSFYKNLNILGTIAAISPLLGLLGTVFGMITTFTAIQKEGVGNAPALAGGISEALITTAVGLSIAIPALIFYRYFHSKAKTLSSELEVAAHEISELLDKNSA